MANYSNLKAAIAAAIKTNGNQEITGQVLQDVLTSMVSVIGANYTFAGVATPATNPGTPDQNVFYLAMEGGTYTNFNGTVLPAGISLLMWNGSWTSKTVMYGDGGVFDISVYKSTGGTLAKYADLAAALDGGNNIPASARKGGMSVKFVQSSENKYVKFFCMAQNFTTDVTQWQGVDDEPTADSDNLVKSGGVKKVITDTNNFVGIKLNRIITFESPITSRFKFLYVNMKAGVTYNIDIKATGTSSSTNFVIGYSKNSSDTIAYNINSSRNLDYTPASDVAWIWAACYVDGGTFDVTVCQKANLSDMLAEVYQPKAISRFKVESVLANIYDLADKQSIDFTDGKGLLNTNGIVDLQGYSVSEELNSGIVMIKTGQLMADYRNMVTYRNGTVVSFTNLPDGKYFLYIPVGCTARICTSTSYKNDCKFAAYDKGFFVSDKLKSIDSAIALLNNSEEELKDYSQSAITGIIKNIGGAEIMEYSESGQGYLNNPNDPQSYGSFGYHLIYDLQGVYVIDIKTVGSGIAGYNGYMFLFVDDELNVKLAFTGADLIQGATVSMNIPVGATKFLASSLSNDNNFYNITAYTSNISGSKRLDGIKVSWFGTSIPSWGYPQLVGEMTGAIVTNEAYGSSAARRGAFAYAPGASYTNDPCKVKGLPWPVPVYGLMMSVAERNEIITNWLDYVDTFIGTYEGEQGAPTNAKPHDINDGEHEELKSTLRNLCYDVRVARHCGIDAQYNTGAVDVSDIYVIEHAYNDVQGIFNDISTNFNTIPDDPYDRNTPIGAINAMIKYIYEHNSKATIVLIGHYECQSNNGIHCKSVIEKVAEYWSLPLMKLYDIAGFNQRKIPSNGYWANGSIWHETGFSFTTSGENWTSNNIALSFGTVAGAYAGTNNGGVVTGTNATALKALLSITEGNGTAIWQPTRQMLMLTDNLHPTALSTRKYLAKLIGNWMVSLAGN